MPMTFTDRARLAWRILRASADSNSLKHAESELMLAFPPDDAGSELPGWNDAMRQQCLEVLLVFAIQGNSGMSAAMAIPTIKRLMEQEPLTPITGEDDQWNDMCEIPGEGYQHRRCSHVFKDGKENQPYTIDGYVFIEDWTDPETQKVHEVAFTGMGSARAISFPWWPVGPTRVRVDAEGNRLDGQPRLAIMPEIEAAPTNAAFIQCDCDCGTACPQGKTGTEAEADIRRIAGEVVGNGQGSDPALQ